MTHIFCNPQSVDILHQNFDSGGPVQPANAETIVVAGGVKLIELDVNGVAR